MPTDIVCEKKSVNLEVPGENVNNVTEKDFAEEKQFEEECSEKCSEKKDLKTNKKEDVKTDGKEDVNAEENSINLVTITLQGNYFLCCI